MISSEDVRRVTFDKAMRGYRCDDTHVWQPDAHLLWLMQGKP